MTSLPSWAVPGRKVVCVDASMATATVPPGFAPFGDLDGLTEGTIYTVKGAYVDIRYPDGGKGCIQVHEISRQFDYGYSVRRFRPIVSLEDDMLTFRSLLNTVPATNHSEELTNVE